MPIIRHHAALQCLVAVRGHPFDRTAFDAMFQAMDGISATMVDQPAAARLMSPEGMAGFDVLVLYDMLKAVSHEMVLGPVRLLHKEGGRRGRLDWPWPECPWV